jgi:hypothetical protein
MSNKTALCVLVLEHVDSTSGQSVDARDGSCVVEILGSNSLGISLSMLYIYIYIYIYVEWLESVVTWK